jgi:glycosyltransferase involved in cell wall biosynthesis
MMNFDGEDPVTVVVPAYNAEATLDETLRSVRAQTHRALEILVVDDGSRDSTPAIALAHAAADPRVRLIRQDNAGVAAARNRGIGEARAALVAPVDADDLWAPAKIERQVATLRRGGPRVALVYTWSALIDQESRVIRLHEATAEGDVLAQLCRGNLVGNGSAALMRRDAVLEAGGYDPTLRARGAQGCEDLLLYCRIAARHHAAVVPDFLTGYRQTGETMSWDLVTMMRSFRLVAAELRGRHPELHADIEAGEAFAARWLLGRALWARDLRAAWALAWSPNGLLPRRMLAAMAAELGSFAAAVAGRRLRRLADGVVGHLRPPTAALPRQTFPLGATPAKAGGG